MKIINGMRIHEPPYTQAEEDEFYRRVGSGPVTVARPAGEADIGRGGSSVFELCAVTRARCALAVRQQLGLRLPLNQVAIVSP